MTHTVNATYSFEIELELSGSYVKGYAGDRVDPPESDGIEDLDIEDMGFISRVITNEKGVGSMTWKTTSILDGVDRKSEAYQQIVRNILAMIETEAAEALLAEVYE